jgi:hypothetical protein
MEKRALVCGDVLYIRDTWTGLSQQPLRVPESGTHEGDLSRLATPSMWWEGGWGYMSSLETWGTGLVRELSPQVRLERMEGVPGAQNV